MNEYLKAQNKTNDAIRTSTFSADELYRFSKSDYRWADNRSKHFRHREVKKGEIYHPIDSPTSKSDLFLLKSSEFSFINHDSVLKLNDIRTVSVNRILYQQNGLIPPDSDTYKKIESLVLQKYFPVFTHEYTQLKEKVAECEQLLKETTDSLEKLNIQNNEFKKQISILKNQLATTN